MSILSMKFGWQLSLGWLNTIKLSRVCVKSDGLAQHNILESNANIDQVKGVLHNDFKNETSNHNATAKDSYSSRTTIDQHW